MYHRDIIAAKLDTLLRAPQLADVLTHGFPDYSIDDARAITHQIVNTKDPETGQTIRRLTPDEEYFAATAKLRVAVDAPFYLETFVQIDEEGHGLRPLYPLWESQRFFLQRLASMELKHEREAHPDGLLANCLKARQLGISTVSEALVSHRIFTTPFVRSICGSDVEEQARYLFRMVERIYAHLPWFLRPEKVVPYAAGRELNLSNKSSLKAAWGKTTRGALQEQGGKKGNIERGRTNSTVHISELATWDNPEQLDTALLPGIPVSRDSLVLFESTAELAGDWWHLHWQACEDGDTPRDWSNIFIPWSVEPSKYALPAPVDWSPNEQTLSVARQIEREMPRYVGETVRLQRNQLYWYETTRAYYQKKNRVHDFLKEYPSNPQECFQYAGRSVFSLEDLEKIDLAARPLIDVWRVEPAKDIAELRRMTEYPEPTDVRVEALKIDRRPAAPATIRPISKDAASYAVPPGFGFRRLGQAELDDLPSLRQTVFCIWEYPRVRGRRRYIVGVDVGDGLGQDYSTVSVIREPTIEEPAEEVAQFVSNTVKPSQLAYVVDAIGRLYPDEDGIEACAAIELNNHGATVQDLLQLHLGYTNFYVWEVVDAANQESRFTKRIGWTTTTRTRPILLEKFHDAVTSFDEISGLADFRINSAVTRKEMRFFVTEGLLGEAEHAKGQHDDCLTPDMLIRTRSGVKPIIAVTIGEEVLTHNGRWRPVTRIGTRQADVVFDVAITGRLPLTLTDNHPMLVRHRIHKNPSRTDPLVGHDLPEWLSIDSGEDMTDFSAVAVPISETVDRPSLSLIDYAPSTYNVVDDRLVAFTYDGTRLNPKQNRLASDLPVDANFCRMMGYYYAEGSRGRHNVGWASHAQEAPIRQWLGGYLSSLGLHPVDLKSSNNGQNLSVGSVPLNRFFAEFGSREHKLFPDWVCLLPTNKLREVLIGYLLGDGSFRGLHGNLIAATISASGAFQLYEMSMKCGWPLTICARVPPNSISQKPVWYLGWAPHTSAQIRACIPPDLLACKRPIAGGESGADQRRVRMDNGQLVGRIMSVTPRPYGGLVYNIEVEEDHSFVANGTVVHNCIFGSAIGYYVAHRQAGGESEPIAERRRRRDTLKALHASQGISPDYRNSDATSEDADQGVDDATESDDAGVFFDPRDSA